MKIEIERKDEAWEIIEKVNNALEPYGLKFEMNDEESHDECCVFNIRNTH